jgi:predicted AlkP superfamily pyrophosphatase or phosphodiesterase
MKKYNFSKTAFFIIGILSIHTTVLGYNTKPPRLTVVLVVDQFAYDYFNKLMPHLKYGLKYLAEHGVVYTNAHMPHGQPGTATGHAGLNTGAYANYHGFVSNSWYEDGEKVACDDDASDNAFVFDPVTGDSYDYGKSADRLMVDGLSDQCVLQTQPRSKFAAYSISGKSRSAIATAGRLGKAIWFDCESGMFTSSKAYFDELPKWVQIFNEKNDVSKLGSITWKCMYPQSPYAYNFFDINNYDYTRTKETMLDRLLPVPDVTNPENKYHFFEKTPQANQLILDCAQACIKTHVSRKHRDRLLLWVCLSPLDKLTHQYGENSMETTDMIYHLDKQIERFIRQTLRVIGKHEVIFVLTADHAVMPIPELLHEKGLTQARRIRRASLIESINKKIKEKYSVENLILAYKSQEFILDPAVTDTLDSEKHANIIKDIKFYALQEPGIKNAWEHDELLHMPTQQGTLEDNIKKQLFKGRSGSVILQTEPYTVITNWPEGASHKTPYNYDTHIPLIIFHPGKFERRYVRQRVSALQLANTLAEVLNIPKPSASVCEILPELFDPEYQ